MSWRFSTVIWHFDIHLLHIRLQNDLGGIWTLSSPSPSPSPSPSSPTSSSPSSPSSSLALFFSHSFSSPHILAITSPETRWFSTWSSVMHFVKPILLKQFFFETYTKRSKRQCRIGACTRRIRRWRRRKRTTSRHPLNRTSRDTDTQRRLTRIKDGTRKRRRRIGKMDLQRPGIDGVLPLTRCVEFEVNGERLLCVLGEDFLTSWNFWKEKKMNGWRVLWSRK